MCLHSFFLGEEEGRGLINMGAAVKVFRTISVLFCHMCPQMKCRIFFCRRQHAALPETTADDFIFNWPYFFHSNLGVKHGNE